MLWPFVALSFEVLFTLLTEATEDRPPGPNVPWLPFLAAPYGYFVDSEMLDTKSSSSAISLRS